MPIDEKAICEKRSSVIDIYLTVGDVAEAFRQSKKLESSSLIRLERDGSVSFREGVASTLS